VSPDFAERRLPGLVGRPHRRFVEAVVLHCGKCGGHMGVARPAGPPIDAYLDECLCKLVERAKEAGWMFLGGRWRCGPCATNELPPYTVSFHTDLYFPADRAQAMLDAVKEFRAKEVAIDEARGTAEDHG
jgi:hypothetical protein